MGSLPTASSRLRLALWCGLLAGARGYAAAHIGTPARQAVRAAAPRAAVAADEAQYSEVYGDKKPALSLAAPCKINLFLRILKKREDGFHELASLFQTVSLMDTP